jgi:hypothetical protein
VTYEVWRMFWGGGQRCGGAARRRGRRLDHGWMVGSAAGTERRSRHAGTGGVVDDVEMNDARARRKKRSPNA